MTPIHPALTKVSGPPGTGKSTYLLDVVERLLSSGVEPSRIVFTTFTRAGAYEARDRACSRFKLPAQALPYFRTLHSLCHSLLPAAPVMQNPDWFVIAKRLGLGLNLAWLKETEGEIALTGNTQRGDYLLYLWMIGRVRCEPLIETWKRRIPGPEVTIGELEHFGKTVEAYKAEFGKRDFTDMMEDWLEIGQDPRASHVIVDEAQDLSLLQGKVVAKLCQHAREVWVAGDDDQCIHEWNGADPKWLINLPCRKHIVLPQSYRIPISVQKMALWIVNKIGLRIPKEYKPRQTEGFVVRINQLDTVDMSTGSWFLLARNQVYLQDYVDYCRRKGLLYTGTMSDNQNSHAIEAILTWNLLTTGFKITGAQAKHLYKFLSRMNRVKNGFKKAIENVDDQAAFSYEDLVETMGLVAPKDLRWTAALDRINPEEKSYLEAVERHGNLHDTARVEIGTIHSVKGREADNVVIRPEMTPRTFESFRVFPDQEHRVWYVATTRAKERLYMLPATSPRSYPLS